MNEPSPGLPELPPLSSTGSTGSASSVDSPTVVVQESHPPVQPLYYLTPATGPFDSRSVSVIASMVVATCLNLFAIALMCFFVMPKVDESVAESTRNREAIVENGKTIQASQVELERYRKTIDRLNAAMDANEARLRSLKEKGLKP